MTREEYYQQFVQMLESPGIKLILGEDTVAKYKDQFSDANETQLMEAIEKLGEFEADADEVEQESEAKAKDDDAALNKVIAEVNKNQLDKAKQMAGKEDDKQLDSIEAQLNNV